MNLKKYRVAQTTWKKKRKNGKLDIGKLKTKKHI